MKLALGSAQFGLAYGSRRPEAPVVAAEVGRILARAWESGIDVLDTAPGYGRAEEVLAANWPAPARFAVVTKTARLADAGSVAGVASAAKRSRRTLRRPALSALLVHHAPDLLGADGDALYSALLELRGEGVTERIGVSVYDPETLSAVLGRHAVDCVQLPMNLLDQRFLQAGLLSRLKDDGIEVHARSVYLQGRLLMRPESLPCAFAGARPALEHLRLTANAAGISVQAVLIGAVMACGLVDRLVVGVDSRDDLDATLAAFAEAGERASAIDYAQFAMDDLGVIDPRRWAS